MSVPTSSNSVSVDRTGPSWLSGSAGYELLGNLSQLGAARSSGSSTGTAQPRTAPVGRADVQVAVSRSSRSLEQMVLIKCFESCPAEADWLQLVAELEFASQLCHENIVRTLGIGLEAGRYFTISEYLEGATLDAVLESCAAAGAQLPHVAVVRILLGILSAVKHAETMASSGQARALARAPIAVDDVFISADGQVKVLGFKSSHARALARPTAIDALFEQQLTPELRRVLPRLARAANEGGAGEPADDIRRALCAEGAGAEPSDGRAELALALHPVWRNERALQALRLARAFARLRGPVRRPPPLAGGEDVAPASGYRRIGTPAAPGSEPPVFARTLRG